MSFTWSMRWTQCCQQDNVVGLANFHYKCYMSFFAAELLDLIKSRFQGNQQRFSRATGIDPSIVSRQCSGRAMPDPNTILKIIAGISPEDAASLVAAYLRDACPPSVRDLVVIQTLKNPENRSPIDLSRHLLDLSALTARDQDVTRAVVRLLQVDASASEFLNHSIKLITRSAPTGITHKQ